MTTTELTNPAKALNRALGARSRNRTRAHKDTILLDKVSAMAGRNDLLPNLVLENRPLSGVHAAERLLRKAEEHHIAEVMQSIKTFGVTKPILIKLDGEIIEGHIVFLAAQRLELPTIPCIVVGHLDETEVRLLRLALNRLAEKGSWDLEALKIEFNELIELDGRNYIRHNISVVMALLKEPNHTVFQKTLAVSDFILRRK